MGKITKQELSEELKSQLESASGTGDIDLSDGTIIKNVDESIVINKDVINIKEGKFNLEGHNNEILINQYGVNPKFIDYSKNLIWNSSFEVHDQDNKPYYWTIIGSGESNTQSSFHRGKSLRLGEGAIARQAWAARIKPWWIKSQKVRVSMYINFEKNIEVRVVDIGKWHESAEDMNYYLLKDELGNEANFLVFQGSDGWEDSRIAFTFESNQYPSDSVTNDITAFALEIKNIDTGDVYIDGVMAHVDFTGEWAQLYKDGPRSLSLEEIGEFWTDSGEEEAQLSNSAEMINYDNSVTGMVATQVQGAIDELFTDVDDGKKILASAINDKGVSTTGDETFEELVSKIYSITCGSINTRPVENLSSGREFSMAIANDGTVYSWGRNSRGVLGIGSGTEDNFPSPKVVVSGQQDGVWNSTTPFENAISISAGSGHSLLIDSNNDVYGLGNNYDGQLALGTSTTTNNQPRQCLSGEQDTEETYLKNIVQASAGTFHSLFLDMNKNVYACGRNTQGALGNGSTVNSLSVIKVHGGAQGGTYLEDIVQVSAGNSTWANFSSSAIDSAGNVYAWGNNSEGQLGTGNNTNSWIPSKMYGGDQGGVYMENAVKVCSLLYATFVLDTAGNVYHAGAEQFHATSGTKFYYPARVAGGDQGGTYLENIVNIWGNTIAMFAKDIKGHVYSWGGHWSNGSLGMGDLDLANIWMYSPKRVLGGGQNRTYISTTGMIGAAMLNGSSFADIDGNVYMCGNSQYGRLGNGLTNSTIVYEPQKVLRGEQPGTATYFNLKVNLV